MFVVVLHISNFCCRDNNLLQKCMAEIGGLRQLLDSCVMPRQQDDDVVTSQHATDGRDSQLDALYSAHALHRCAVCSDLFLQHRGIGMHMCQSVFRTAFPRPSYSFEFVENSADFCCQPMKRNVAWDDSYCCSRDSVASDAAVTSAQQKRKADNCIIFVVDGQEVVCCRDVMMNRSEVFKVMIQGQYIESKQSRIGIQHASLPAFQIVCDILHGDIGSFKELVLKFHHHFKCKKPDVACSSALKLIEEPRDLLSLKSDNEIIETENSGNNYFKPVEATTCVISDEVVHTCLDVLELCERFLLNDVKADVTHVVFEHVVNERNAIEVHNFVELPI